MKVDVAVLGSLSLTVFVVSVDVKQHLTEEEVVYNYSHCLCDYAPHNE